MNCVINDLLKASKQKGITLEVIRRYVRMKYKIQIDMRALQERLRTIQLKPGL